MVWRSSTAASIERTGWRDEALSKRHRRYGFDLPATDIDFLMVEYDGGRAIAIVEYKHARARPQLARQSNYRALIDLGDRAGIPVFACRYAGDLSRFFVIPLNGRAHGLLPERRRMSEIEWVRFLYGLRGREMPQGLFDDDGHLTGHFP